MTTAPNALATRWVHLALLLLYGGQRPLWHRFIVCDHAVACLLLLTSWTRLWFCFATQNRTRFIGDEVIEAFKTPPGGRYGCQKIQINNLTTLDYTLKLINQAALLEYVLKIHAFMSFWGWWKCLFPNMACYIQTCGSRIVRGGPWLCCINCAHFTLARCCQIYHTHAHT